MSLTRATRPAVAILAAALLAPSSLALAADTERGRALYEMRCGGCHSESVHGRTKRAAADFEEVRQWVARWSQHLGLGWGAEDIDDVAVHLNNSYYRFACPPETCKVISLAPRPR